MYFLPCQVLNTVSKSGLIKGAIQKTGVASGLMNQFGDVELLDDIVDHWDADEHKHERGDLIAKLQVLLLPLLTLFLPNAIG